MPINEQAFFELYRRAGNDERKKAALDEYARRKNIDMSQYQPAKQDEDFYKLYQSIGRDPRRRAELEEYARKQGIDIEPVIKPKEQALNVPDDEIGPLDYLMGTIELGGQIGSGSVAEPVSGLAGMAVTPFAGAEKGAETIKTIQEIGTYQPKTEGYKAVAGGLGKVIKPIMETVSAVKEPVSEAVGSAGEALAGHEGQAFAKAALDTGIAAIPEILGLKGTKAAKKAALRRIADKVDIGNMYDELGNLIPEIKQSIDKANISEKELRELIEDIPTKSLEKPIEMIQEATGTSKKLPSERIAVEIKPNKEILEAATEFDMAGDLLPSHYSENYIYRALEQGLKSMPASMLSSREAAAIEKMARKADELIESFGAVADKAELSDVFRTDSLNLIDDMGKKAGKLYDRVGKKIPKNTKIEANNTIKLIEGIAEEQGGLEFLSPREKMLLNKLGNKKQPPTYARIDRIRKQIGEALSGKNDLFKNIETGDLKRYYKALAADQQAVADTFKMGKTYKTAQKITAARKGIEKQLQTVIGKDVTGSITAKAGNAINQLTKGNTQQFDRLLANIPKELGPEFRKSIIATSLNDAFTLGSRKEKSLNVAGFDDFMAGLNKNQTAKKRITDEIGEDAMKRLETFHKIASGVRRAQSKQISTGLIVAVPKMFDEAKGLAQRLYGFASDIPVAGRKIPGMIESLVTPKKARSELADQLLASPKFKAIVDKVAQGKIDTANKIKRADEIVKNIKAFQKWSKRLPKRDYKDLMAIGPIGYLTGEEMTRGEE